MDSEPGWVGGLGRQKGMASLDNTHAFICYSGKTLIRITKTFYFSALIPLGCRNYDAQVDNERTRKPEYKQTTRGQYRWV